MVDGLVDSDKRSEDPRCIQTKILEDGTSHINNTIRAIYQACALPFFFNKAIENLIFGIFE